MDEGVGIPQRVIVEAVQIPEAVVVRRDDEIVVLAVGVADRVRGTPQQLAVLAKNIAQMPLPLGDDADALDDLEFGRS